MPTYSTYTDLVRRYGLRKQAALAADGSGEAIETLAADAQTEAFGEINAALSARGYVVPVDTVAVVDVGLAALMRRLELALAVTALSREHGEIEDKDTREAAHAEAVWARDFLASVGKGSVLPGLSAPGASFITVTTSDEPPVLPTVESVDERIDRAGAW